jgi:hypothetical protein
MRRAAVVITHGGEKLEKFSNITALLGLLLNARPQR